MYATGHRQLFQHSMSRSAYPQAYSASQSFPDALAALEDLESYGFIYRPRDETGQPGDEFYPTHLATSLCSGDIGSLGSQTADEKRFLILETNYKIYAYTCGYFLR
jgi:transcription initiation factor TFIIH subunit 4